MISRWLVLLAIAAMGCGEPQPERHTLRYWSGALVGQDIGGIVGGGLAVRMDGNDRRRAGGVLERAQMHETHTWINPETGTAWEMTPIAGSAGPSGLPCREFSITARDALEDHEEAYGVACREPSGDWRVTS